MPWRRYWIKLWTEMRLDPKYAALDLDQQAVWTNLLMATTGSPEPGAMLLPGGQAMSEAQLRAAALAQSMDPERFRATLGELERSGMVHWAEGALVITHWQERQAPRDKTAAERKRRQRDRVGQGNSHRPGEMGEQSSADGRRVTSKVTPHVTVNVTDVTGHGGVTHVTPPVTPECHANVTQVTAPVTPPVTPEVTEMVTNVTCHGDVTHVTPPVTAPEVQKGEGLRPSPEDTEDSETWQKRMLVAELEKLDATVAAPIEIGPANGRKKIFQFPEWFEPLSGLPGYRRCNHGKFLQVLEDTCREAEVSPAAVIRSFAEYYRLNRFRHGWSDPVKALRNTLLREIAKVKSGGSAQGLTRAPPQSLHQRRMELERSLPPLRKATYI